MPPFLFQLGRLTLLALAVVFAFVAASYKTPTAVATGGALAIAAFAAAPAEVSSFALTATASALEGVCNVSHGVGLLCMTCAEKINPDLREQAKLAPTAREVCFGNEVQEVRLILVGLPIDEQAAQQLVLQTFDQCRSLAAIEQASPPSLLSPRGGPLSANTDLRQPASAA